MPSHCAGLLQARCTYASYPDTLKERKKRQRNMYYCLAFVPLSIATSLLWFPLPSSRFPLPMKKKKPFAAFGTRENTTHGPGAAVFFFSTQHVELFNFDPPDRGGEGYLIPPPLPDAILIPI